MKAPRPPPGLFAQRLDVGDESLVVFSWPLDSPGLPDVGLTDAEQDVALRILGGASDADIAAARGTSVRTVAKQAATLYRKFGVRSRRELAAAVAGRRPAR